MPTLANSFDGGTDGAGTPGAVTIGNSGGANGDAWTLVSVPASSTCEYSVAALSHGALGLDVTTTAATIAVYVQKDLTPADSYVERVYHKAPGAIPNASGTLIMGYRTAAASAAYVAYNSSGKFQVYNSTGSAVGAASTMTPASNTLYRIEFGCAPGTTTTSGNCRVTIYLGDSTTVLDTWDVLGQNFGAAQITRTRIGRAQGTAWIGTLYFDSFKCQDLPYTSLIGPVPSAGTTTVRPSAVASNTGAWVNVGGAANIAAALADELDTTYAESPDNPVATPFVVDHPALAAGSGTVNVRLRATAGPARSCLVELLQGPSATVISSRNYTNLSTSWTDQSWTLTQLELDAITDRSQLQLRYTAS